MVVTDRSQGSEPAVAATGGPPFSLVLREATQQAHTDAESSPFIDRLMSGNGDREDVVRLAMQLHPIYDALERPRESDPIRERFADPRLRRLPALEEDLAYLLGEAWRDCLEPVPAAREYAAHIDAVGHSTPAYVGHHYTRYLGDLSGGRLIARRVAAHYGLAEGRPGLLFYSFPEIAKPKVFKDRYRLALDTAPWGAGERAAVVAEARRAFTMNQAVFAALA